MGELEEAGIRVVGKFGVRRQGEEVGELDDSEDDGERGRIC